MNSKERLDAYLAKEAVDRRPNLTIVGSVVTQYTGIDITEYCKNPIEMAKSAILAAHDLKLDYVQIASDLVREAEGYGSEILFTPDRLPTLKKPALEDILDVSKLGVKRAKDVRRMYDLVEAASYAVENEGEIYAMVLAVGPMTVAGNIRGVEDLMVDCYDEPEAVDELLDKVTQTQLDLIKELAAVGVKYIYVADPVASLMPPKFYRGSIMKQHVRLYEQMKSLGVTGRLHMCGNTAELLPMTTTVGAAVVDIDHEVDFKRAVEIAGDSCVVNGNIDPVADVFSCEAEHTEEAILKTAESVGNRRAMFMPGCELPTATKRENVLAIHKALVKIGG